MERKRACVISSYAYIVEHINYGALLQYYALEKALKKDKIFNAFIIEMIILCGIIKKSKWRTDGYD